MILDDPLGFRHTCSYTFPLKIGSTVIGIVCQYLFNCQNILRLLIYPGKIKFYFGKLIDISYSEILDAFLLTAKQKNEYSSVIVVPISKKCEFFAEILNEAYQERRLELEVQNNKLFVVFQYGKPTEQLCKLCYKMRQTKVVGIKNQILIPTNCFDGIVGLLPKEMVL